MSNARVIEINATSETSFEDAINQGMKRVCAMLQNVKNDGVKSRQTDIINGNIVRYKVRLLIRLMLDSIEPTEAR